ncbi:MAG: hypothetical protein E7403_00865 [Ruminococcaceae bacterium]|nr:hypothetical protein [Oscillospiraceae bacterium]
MNWGRAKTILIIMFLTVDAFLLFVLLQTRLNYERLPKETVQKTVQVLRDKGIDIREETVPLKRAKNQNINMKNSFGNPIQAAEVFLGTYEVKLSDDEKHEYLFENERATLRIKETYVTYQNKKNYVRYEQNEKADEKNIKKWLTELGFKTKEFAIVKGKQRDGLFCGQVVPVYKDIKMYGISMSIKTDKEAIVTMEGHWFSPQEAEVYEDEQLLDVTAVLAGLIHREDRWPKTVVSIENGFYMAGDYLDSREFVALPIYVITDERGNQKFFDARIGHEIN